MGKHLKVVEASKSSPIITKSKFANYDHCMNPYVGCQFGCTYCYVRFFVKDKEEKWGDFLRVRLHLEKRLPKDIKKIGSTRLVIGTMTDPYQPREIKYRLMRKALEILKASQIKMDKIGIFTRSPLIKQDLDLIKSLPNPRVHFTITPYTPEILKKIEPVAVASSARFKTVKAIKDAGIRVHVNVAPSIPLISEEMIEPWAERLAEIGVDEFFVDPMQPYSDSMKAFEEAFKGDDRWVDIYKIMTDKKDYKAWKKQLQEKWTEAWRKVANKSPHTLALAQDHELKTKTNMVTGQQLDWNHES